MNADGIFAKGHTQIKGQSAGPPLWNAAFSQASNLSSIKLGSAVGFVIYMVRILIMQSLLNDTQETDFLPSGNLRRNDAGIPSLGCVQAMWSRNVLTKSLPAITSTLENTRE